jgi:acetoacetate decarboxylase
MPVAVATMGYKHRTVAPAPLLASLSAPNFLLKIIPHVNGKPRICELVRYYRPVLRRQPRLVHAIAERRRRCLALFEHIV